MRVPVIGALRMVARAILFLFGRGLGSNRLLQFLFRHIVSSLIRKKCVLALADGYRLGMTVGGDRGWDEEALSLLFGGGYEPRMTEVFKSVVKPNMNVVDVGAHIGYYTVLASRLVGDGGKVWAFEPEPMNHAELVRNIELNECKNVVAVPKAVGDESGKARLYFYGQYSGQRSLVDVGFRNRRKVEVNVVSLDEFLCGNRIDVVKIDVDGGEMGVLMGMCDLIRSNSQMVIFTELWKAGLEDAGYSCADAWYWLVRGGLGHIYLMSDRLKQPLRIGLDGLLAYVGRFGGANLVCSRNAIAKDRVVW